jgi:tetratricopeptide (TPR) repeat protein
LRETNNNDLEKLIEFAEQADYYAKITFEKPKYAEILNSIGLEFYMKSNYTLTQKYFELSLEIEKEIGNEKNVAKLYSNIAVTYELKGNYEKAIDYYNFALNTFEKLNYEEGCGKIYNNLGVLYQEMGMYNQCISYFDKSLKIKLKNKDFETAASTYNNIGVSYEEFKINLDSALYYYNKALSIYDSLQIKLNFAITLQNIAAVYTAQKDISKSIETYYKIEKIFIELNNNQGLAWTYRNLANAFLSTNDFKNVENYLTKSYKLSAELNDIQTYLEVTKLFADYYFKINKYKLSTEFLYKYIKLNDSIKGIENQKNIDELNKKYETNLLEYKINDLNNENQLKNERLKKNNVFIVFLIVMLLLIIIVFAILRLLKKNKNERIKIELEQRILRLQMNPHFISNVLVSAQNFILENKALEAADYLSDFSTLMRDSIKATSNEYISLYEEILILEKYLKVQQQRLQHLFDFQINISPEIETEFIKFPPMLLQPFVENSIKHGFKNIDYKGEININIYTENKNIKTEIIDNGVGFLPNTDSKHTSYSLEITKQRLKNITKKTKKFTNISITNNKNIGTKVEIILPDII